MVNIVIYRHYRKDMNKNGFVGFLAELRKRQIPTLPHKKLKAATVCEKICVTDRGLTRHTGIAFCSRKDQFSRREGRERAELRANEAMNLNVSFCTTKIKDEDELVKSNKRKSS